MSGGAGGLLAEQALARTGGAQGGRWFVRLSWLGILGLAAAAWSSLVADESARATGLFSERSLTLISGLVQDLLGVGPNARGTPAFLRPDAWAARLPLLGETAAMSVLATALAVALALPLAMAGARNIAFGGLWGGGSRWLGGVLFAGARALFAFSRAVPELVWAVLVIFAFTPGMLPGAIALALHNAGVIGKLFSEVIEDIDDRPIRALLRSGASPTKALLFGVLPMAAPAFVTYSLYRWEVIVRTAIAVGTVGAGGLGREFRLEMAYLHFDDVTLLLLLYLGLVLAVDAASAGLRRLLD